jgi:hypothetical protein
MLTLQMTMMMFLTFHHFQSFKVSQFLKTRFCDTNPQTLAGVFTCGIRQSAHAKLWAHNAFEN